MINILNFNELSFSRDVRLAKDKDQVAFRRLIENEKSKLYRIGKGILKSDFDVDDAIQETILKAWLKLGTLKDNKSFSTWITRILINECYIILRKKVNIADVTGYDIATKDSSIDVNNKIDVWNSLEKLNDDFKLPLILYFFEDLSYEDISAILNIPKGTVRSRISRGKEKLEGILKDYNRGDSDE